MTPPQTAASSRDPWMNTTVGAPSILVALYVNAFPPSPVFSPTITAFVPSSTRIWVLFCRCNRCLRVFGQFGTRVQDLIGTSRYRSVIDRGSRYRELIYATGESRGRIRLGSWNGPQIGTKRCELASKK